MDQCDIDITVAGAPTDASSLEFFGVSAVNVWVKVSGQSVHRLKCLKVQLSIYHC